MKLSATLMFITSMLAVVVFALFLNTDVFNDVLYGDGCIKIETGEGPVCQKAKDMRPPPLRGYAFTAMVVNFVFGIITTASMARGAISDKTENAEKTE